MSTNGKPAIGLVRLYELRPYQVYRLDRPRSRSLLQRLRRTLRVRLGR